MHRVLITYLDRGKLKKRGEGGSPSTEKENLALKCRRALAQQAQNSTSHLRTEYLWMRSTHVLVTTLGTSPVIQLQRLGYRGTSLIRKRPPLYWLSPDIPPSIPRALLSLQGYLAHKKMPIP